MPKVLYTQAARDADAVKRWEARFRATIAYHKELKSLNTQGIASRMGIPRSTMYNKLDHPYELTVGEALRLMKLLDFTNTERGDIFGIAFEPLKPASNE